MRAAERNRAASVSTLLALTVCALLASCIGRAGEAARRDVALAVDKRDLALSLNPSRDEEIGIQAYLKQAQDALEAGDYDRASKLSRASRELSEKAYAAKVGEQERIAAERAAKREELTAKILSIRSEIEKVQKENSSGLDHEGLFRELKLRVQEVDQASAAGDYGKAIAVADETLMILDKRALLYSTEPHPGLGNVPPPSPISPGGKSGRT